MTMAVHDPMHVLLEGVFILELKLLFQHPIVEEGLFNVRWLNDQLEKFQYSYLEVKDKPPLFDVSSIRNSETTLCIGASVVLTLLSVLPFILCTVVAEDNEKWQNFVVLLNIVQLVIAPNITDTTIGQLELLIAIDQKTFRQLYPTGKHDPQI